MPDAAAQQEWQHETGEIRHMRGTDAPRDALPGADTAARERAARERAASAEPFVAEGWPAPLSAWTARHPRALLGLALVLAVVARVVLVAHTHAMIDGDEALVGIQAERILHGQYPTYFYGQPYMGSLEAYLAAAVFRVVGPSSWALRSVPIALSLLLVYLTWRLARALLPAAGRLTPLLAGLAALVAAVPPLYDAVAELRTWGGQIEVYVLTLALLLGVVRLADRLREDARPGELALRWAALGVVAGLGIWINPLISYALVVAALWLVPPLCARAFPRRWAALTRRLPAGAREALSAPSTLGSAPPQAARTGRSGGVLAPVLALLPGLALGGLPAWLYALRQGGANLLVYISQPQVNPAISGAARHGRLFLGAAITARYASCVAPRVLDGGLPSESLAWLPLRGLLLIPPVVGIVGALWLVARHGLTPGIRLRAGLPLLYAAVLTAVFCLGTSAWPATKSCTRDEAGRYAVPLALVLPFLLLAVFAVPGLWRAFQRRRAHGPAALTADAQPAVSPAISRAWSVLLVVLLVGGAVQLATYPLANPTTTFQSPFYRHVPLDDGQLLSYLADHHIHDAWVNHWLGNIVTFQTDGRTLCADYYDQVTLHGIERPPGSLETVAAADDASFILVLTDPHPQLAQRLDALRIPYTLAVLPQSGVTVITPARTVNPALVAAALSQDYPY